jgi:hypothetical protein
LAKHFSKYIKINNDNAEAKLAWRKRLFIEKLEKNIMWDYLIYSQHVSHYNEIHNIDTKEEIAKNNNEARKLFADYKQAVLNLK